MIKSNLFDISDSRIIVDKIGCFSVLEYKKDISIYPELAQEAYFASEMNVRKRQLIVNLENNNGVYVQAGEMQLMVGDVDGTTNVKGPGDLLKKIVGSVVTDETVIKPYYYGNGMLVLEPTFYHILLEDVSKWGDGLIIEDGMFLACNETVDLSIKPRETVSSALFGGEGLFNMTLSGEGIVALESPIPADELVIIDLEDDRIMVDGNMAIAWSASLDFRVDKSMRTLIGSAVSGEGLVNVYEGTGRVMIAPVRKNRGINAPEREN